MKFKKHGKKDEEVRYSTASQKIQDMNVLTITIFWYVIF